MKRNLQVDANGNIISIGDYRCSRKQVFSFNDAAPDPAEVDQKIQLVRVL
jgi:hypothetical protein